MSNRAWTFVRCGIDGKPDGVYDERYEQAAIGALAALGDRAEFVHDEDMPEPLRYRGSWGKLALYNPDLDIGNQDGNVFVADLDTVFIRDIDGLANALDAPDHAIVGNRCFGDRKFNSMVLRIRRGSREARRVWTALQNDDFQPRERIEHYFVRRAAGGGVMENGHIESYRGYLGKFPRKVVPKPDIDKVSALVFHGKYKPHDICDHPSLPLHDLVMEHWGKYAGY